MPIDRTLSSHGLKSFQGLALLVVAILLAAIAGSSRGDPYGVHETAPEHKGPRGGIGFGIDLTCILTGCGKDKWHRTNPASNAAKRPVFLNRTAHNDRSR